MGYGNKIFQAACQELEQRKRRAEEKAEQGRARFYHQCPRAREIREEMARNATGAARAVLSGGDVRAEITQLKDKGLALKEEYNRLLAESSMGQVPAVDDRGDPITPESYWELLNLDATGMMGYIEIPRLNLSIPIYHGTEEEVLQVGIGHLQNTSLPVGGRIHPCGPFGAPGAALPQPVYGPGPAGGGRHILH